MRIQNCYFCGKPQISKKTMSDFILKEIKFGKRKPSYGDGSFNREEMIAIYEYFKGGKNGRSKE